MSLKREKKQARKSTGTMTTSTLENLLNISFRKMSFRTIDSMLFT